MSCLARSKCFPMLAFDACRSTASLCAAMHGIACVISLTPRHSIHTCSPLQVSTRKIASARDINMSLFTAARMRSEEHTSELQSLMRISYAVFCLQKKKENKTKPDITQPHINSKKNYT